MENRQQQILNEIKSLMESIRTQISDLEIKMSELQHMVDPEALDLDVMDMEISPAEPETYLEPVREMEVELREEPVLQEEPELQEEPALQEEPEPVTDDLPFFDDLPETEEALPAEAVDLPVETDDLPEAKTDIPVIDAMIEKQAWRTDMPGSPVRDIRSAISLNDRILFINFLFKEDPMAFQEMLTRLNSINSFDEAASYVISACPDWDLESDTVYRFMMALRRRLQ